MTKIKQHPGILKSVSKHGALLLSLMMIAGSFANSSTGETDNKSRKQPSSSVLILTGAGMMPSGFEDSRADEIYDEIYLAVMNVCVQALGAALEEEGIDSLEHIISDRSESPREAVAQQLRETPRDALLQVGIKYEQEENENIVYLFFEFTPLEYVHVDGGESVLVQEGMTKRYPLLPAAEDDYAHFSFSKLAKKFVQELREQGFI